MYGDPLILPSFGSRALDPAAASVSDKRDPLLKDLTVREFDLDYLFLGSLLKSTSVFQNLFQQLKILFGKRQRVIWKF